MVGTAAFVAVIVGVMQARDRVGGDGPPGGGTPGLVLVPALRWSIP